MTQNNILPKGAVYYIDTGKRLPDFIKDKPRDCDKEQFFKGDWKKAWPRDFRVAKGKE
jgi:hypothetical protein